MGLRVLAIGDSANLMAILSKFTKKTKIHVINFPRYEASLKTYVENVEYFNSWKVSEHVKKINKIKHNFDLCITIGGGSLIAYLCDLNYIIYFVGGDIRNPQFKKNSRLSYLEQPIYKLNFLERNFHKKVLDNAIACVTGGDELYSYLKKVRKDAIRIDETCVDTSIFNENVEPIKQTKTKFTFLSPERFGIEKGFDLLWEALPMCKSDFEILQPDWYDKRTREEEKINRDLLEKRPYQVKIIPVIKYEDMPKYYRFVDAVIGELRIGTQGGIEREAALCKKPVISYCSLENFAHLGGKKINPPFLPRNTDPKDLAELIDKIVECESFREKLATDEYNFEKRLSDPLYVVPRFEELFIQLNNKYKTIKKNSSFLLIKFRYYYLLIINRLYFGKLKKLLKYNEN